jgi:transcriptional regulator with XRE-family HTH domain
MSAEAKRELRQLGETIRKQRNALNVSQEDYAELCDLHRTYVGQLERGEKNVSFINILRVAKAFKLKPSELFKKSGL